MPESTQTTATSSTTSTVAIQKTALDDYQREINTLVDRVQGIPSQDGPTMSIPRSEWDFMVNGLQRAKATIGQLVDSGRR